MNLEKKQLAFNAAMRKYHDKKRYGYIYLVVSFLNVSLQLYLFVHLFSLHLDFSMGMALFLLAYFLSDFINGYVHMYMDNNAHYDSMMGPFIASFHLHHRHPEYRDFSVLRIYFNESGPKFWLLPFLMLTVFFVYLEVADALVFVLICIGILSSIAEVSHFLCHNSKSTWVRILQDNHLLLSPKHHAHHHDKDNQSYAFLNGMSDFLLDKIAAKIYGGYKEKSDLHSHLYQGVDTKNRV